MDRQLRRRAGMPKKTSRARTAPPPSHSFPLPTLGKTRSDVVEVVGTVAVTCWLVFVALNVTDELLRLQVDGGSVGLLTDDDV
jgi:hypothetical protein